MPIAKFRVPSGQVVGRQDSALTVEFDLKAQIVEGSSR
jgi:hypothetical protein